MKPAAPLWVRLAVMTLLVGIAAASIWVIDRHVQARQTPQPVIPSAQPPLSQ